MAYVEYTVSDNVGLTTTVMLHESESFMSLNDSAVTTTVIFLTLGHVKESEILVKFPSLDIILKTFVSIQLKPLWSYCRYKKVLYLLLSPDSA